MPRGRACCQTSCGVSACRTWLSSTLRMIWLCTLQMPAWDGTQWTRWAQGPARSPGPRALQHGRVRPRRHTLTHTHLHKYIHSVCPVGGLDRRGTHRTSFDLTFIRAGLGLVRPSGVMWFKALQDGRDKEEVGSGGWGVGGESMWFQWEERTLCFSLHCRLAGCVGPDKLWTEYRDSATMNEQGTSGTLKFIPTKKHVQQGWKKEGTKHWSGRVSRS